MLTQSEFVELQSLPTGNIADANGKAGNMDAGIKPIDRKMKFVGPAFTVKCFPRDNEWQHYATLNSFIYGN